MYYSSHQEMEHTQQLVSTFGGYCHKDVIRDGQFYETKNMSADKYPAITTRAKRKTVTAVAGEDVASVAAICDKDGLVWLGTDGSLHAGGHRLSNFYAWDERERQLISMGGYLIVWPDKLWANAARLKLGQSMERDTDYGSLEAFWEQGDDANTLPITENNAMRLMPCQPDGSYWKYIPDGWEEVSGEPTGETDAAEEQNAVDTTSYPYQRYTSAVGSTQWTANGGYYGYISGDRPEDPEDGCLYLDAKSDPPAMLQWSGSTRMWSIRQCLTRIESVQPFAGIEAGDSAQIALPGVSCSLSQSVGAFTVIRYSTHYGTEDNVAVTAAGKTEDERTPYWLAVKLERIPDRFMSIGSYHRQLVNIYLSLPGHYNVVTQEQLETAWTMSDDTLITRIKSYKGASLLEKLRPVTISRTVPQMDYVIECGNRLWGCYYGEGADGQILNEIYASKLGDFKNWNSFQGIATDSYAASRGTDGAWTGAIAMNNYPLFFKRNYLEKIYISASGAHQIATTRMPGVQPGSWRSLQIIDGVLFYLGDNGVMIYDGSLPDHISGDLGAEKYKNGVAGKLGYTYYLSVQTAQGESRLFTLDTTRGIWHREDDARFTQSADRGDVLYLLRDDGALIAPGSIAEGDDGELEKDFTWQLITGPIGYELPEQEYLVRLLPRLKLEPGASARIHVQYDDNGTWQRVACIEGNRTKSVNVPIRPRRCDHFRIRLQGIGQATLHTITREIEKGSVY